MAIAPKKTYSRRENESFNFNDMEKENFDPFDVLRASPMKQDVQFQPLGFWAKKVRNLSSKKKKEVKCGLFEPNESDGHNLSWKKSKTRSLQPKGKLSKLADRRKDHSCAYSFTEKGKQEVLPNEHLTLKSAKEIIKRLRYPLKNKSNKLDSSFKSCDSFESKTRLSNYANYTKSSGNFNRTFNSVYFNCDDEIISVNNLEFKTFGDNSPAEQLKDINENFINKSSEDSINETVFCNESMEETLIPLHKGLNETVDCNETMEETLIPLSKVLNEAVHCNENVENMEDISVGHPKSCDRYKFVTIRRHYNFPSYLSYNGSINSSAESDSFRISSSPVYIWNEHNEASSSVSLNLSEENTIQTEYSESISNAGNNSSDFDETLCPEDFVSQLGSEELATELESSGLSFSNESDLMYFGGSELEDTIEDLQDEVSVDVTPDSSLTSSDTFSGQETVINISQGLQEKNASVAEVQMHDSNAWQCGSSPNRISLLTSGLSDLSMSNADDNNADTENNSCSAEIRNVTKKRGGFFKEETNEKNCFGIINGRRRSNTRKTPNDSEFHQTFEFSPITDRMSGVWNKTVFLGNPVFESTRVLDMGPGGGEISQKQFNGSEKMDCDFEETHHEFGCALKPGKQWFRSLSVLKQIQSGHLRGGALESTRITGRKFESFVQDLIKMQNAVTNTTVFNRTAVNMTNKSGFFDRLSSGKTVIGRREDVSELSVLSKSSYKVLGRSMLERTVKVVQPEESSSAFKSALGLDSNRSLILESTTDSIQPESVDISPRDFILMQCGQEDVLPFEEYFNEKTLPNCKKIGEGVYGEVFMHSDSVIKIIPIEGQDQVNDTPQKTFEEIISEVVIALKLSKLREGDRNRTDGFSEMRRCWCVKGKYPEYLLKLWNAYEQERGSENDSPVMFRDDQLYIILELANGGKDLESFVFNSSLQALSVFIQVAFSLAAAERAFEFEHRDLHWGNVLVSKTDDKFATVTLDDVEYKIPTKGVKVCIIDFTLSRINHEGCSIFNDLAADPELFTAHGDYQFEIYRMMLGELKNDWSVFCPKTNLFWLHYTVDKMMNMVRYRIRNSKAHSKYMRQLKTLESVVLDHDSSASFVLSKRMSDILIKL